jgi:hypothetical protein
MLSRCYTTWLDTEQRRTNGREFRDIAGYRSLLYSSRPYCCFCGTEFDVHKGRRGKRTEPLRKTPWGEIAFQIGGKRPMLLLLPMTNR